MSPRSSTCFQPSQSTQHGGDLGFGVGIISAHEQVVLTVSKLTRIDHQRGADRVERLHDLCAGELALQLLAYRVGVADAERGWEALREVEGIRDVDDDLAVDVCASRGKHFDGKRDPLTPA